MIMMCCGVTYCNNCTGQTIKDMMYWCGGGMGNQGMTQRQLIQDATIVENLVTMQPTTQSLSSLMINVTGCCTVRQIVTWQRSMG